MSSRNSGRISVTVFCVRNSVTATAIPPDCLVALSDALLREVSENGDEEDEETEYEEEREESDDKGEGYSE